MSLRWTGSTPEPEPFQGVGAQHVEVARIAEEAHRVKGSSLKSPWGSEQCLHEERPHRSHPFSAVYGPALGRRKSIKL
jgi:hypothetical protein